VGWLILPTLGFDNDENTDKNETSLIKHSCMQYTLVRI